MMRSWLRLVVCVSLGAYLLANTHLSLAVALVQASCSTSDEREQEPRKQRTCRHCAQKDAAKSPSEKKRDRSDMPACPDCPGDGHECPIPGGCAMCNVAKAPCLDSPPSPEFVSGPLVEFVSEFSSFYLQPSCDSMIRPPRA